MTLPLTNNPSETFSFNIKDEIYKFKQKWSTLGYWTIDILNIDGDPFVYGVKLITRENILDMHPAISFDLRSERPNNPTRNNLDQFELLVLEKNNG